MERLHQVAGIVYRNICTQYGIEVPESQWATAQKVVENNRGKGSVGVQKKEPEKDEKYRRLKEQLEQMWKVKGSVVPVVVDALRAVTPKLELDPNRPQEQQLEPQSRRAQSKEQLRYCTEPSNSQYIPSSE